MLLRNCAIKSWFIFPSHTTSAFALMGKTQKEIHKIYIFARTLYTATLPHFNKMLLDFFNLVDLLLIFMLLCDSLNPVINWVQLWAVGGA